MPPTLSKPSGAAPASLFYITLGALMTVWSGIWFMYLRNHDGSGHSGQFYICTGFLITGLVLLAIGFTLEDHSIEDEPNATVHRAGVSE